MTDTDAATGIAGTGRSELSESGTTKFTWTCPICGDSATRLSASGQAEYVALNALRSHLRISTAEGHGPRHGYPPSVDPDDLDDCVEFDEL